jgi:hypothetical protein
MSATRLYDRLLAVLGKGHDALEFTQLLKDIGSPSRIYTVEDNEFHEFQHLGFALAYSRPKEIFWMLGCEFAGKPVEIGAMQPFPQELYGGISSVDTPPEVERKLGVKATSIKTFKENQRCMAKYEVPPYHFDCVFVDPQGRLQGMTVWV